MNENTIQRMKGFVNGEVKKCIQTDFKFCKLNLREMKKEPRTRLPWIVQVVLCLTRPEIF